MRKLNGQLAIAALGLRSLVTEPCAHAQTTAVPAKAMAEALFERARHDLLTESYDVACARLAASFALEPAAGTLLNLAVCHELQGKTASAWSEYQQLLSLTKEDATSERRVLAAERIGALEGQLCRVDLEVPSRVVGLVLNVNGVSLPPAAWGVPLPWDPGSYVIVARAAGYRDSVTHAKVSGCPRTFRFRLGELVPQALPAARPDPSRSLRHAALAAGGVGLLLIGAGSYWGLRAIDSWSERDRHCRDGACDARAVHAYEDAKRDASLSTAAFAFGIPFFGAGSYLFFTSRGAPTSAQTDSLSIDWRGTF